MSGVLSFEQKETVKRHVDEWIVKGAQLYQTPFERIPILFDLKGLTLGMYRIDHRGEVLRFNASAFAAHFDFNVSETVPHEVAHYLVHQLFPHQKVKPHGQEWKTVMKDFGVKPNVRAPQEMSGVSHRREQQFPYQCGCQHHLLGIRRHQKVIKGQRVYHCTKCHKALRQR